MPGDIKLLYMSKGSRLVIAGIIGVALLASLFNRDAETDAAAALKKSSEGEKPSYYMYVASDGLNVRKGPGVDSDIVTVLYQNDKIMTDKVSHDGWYKIAALDESAEGYVNAAYLSDKPLSEAEIAMKAAQAKAAAASPVSEETASSQPATRSKNPDAATVTDASGESDAETTVVPRGKLTKRSKN